MSHHLGWILSLSFSKENAPVLKTTLTEVIGKVIFVSEQCHANCKKQVKLQWKQVKLFYSTSKNQQTLSHFSVPINPITSLHKEDATVGPFHMLLV